MISWRTSRSLLTTRTVSPWMEAWALSLESLMTATIFLAFSEVMPCLSLIFWRTEELAAGSIFSYSRFLREMPRLTSFWERISMTALSVYSSWRGELDGVGAFELDRGLGVLEVEAGVDLFGGLVDRVLYFLKFYFADYVEAVVGCHEVFLVSSLLSGSIMSGCRGEEAVEVFGGDGRRALRVRCRGGRRGLRRCG